MGCRERLSFPKKLMGHGTSFRIDVKELLIHLTIELPVTDLKSFMTEICHISIYHLKYQTPLPSALFKYIFTILKENILHIFISKLRLSSARTTITIVQIQFRVRHILIQEKNSGEIPSVIHVNTESYLADFVQRCHKIIITDKCQCNEHVN